MSENDLFDMRRSQFVLTYGPGSIIESQNGARLIPKPGTGIRNWGSDLLENFEIEDVRMGAVLGKNSKIYSLPSNAKLNKEGQYLYSTYIFPRWKICKSSEHDHFILHNRSKCPQCNSRKNSTQIRFILACPEGHMDDIDWNWVVHGSDGCEAGDRSANWFFWITGGSSLSDIKVKCPACEREKTLGDIYDIDFKCTGRSPEEERKQGRNSSPPFHPRGNKFLGECESDMKVVLRQSTSLRLPEVITLLTIPKYDTPLMNILKHTEVRNKITSLLSVSDEEKEKFMNFLEKDETLKDKNKEIIVDFIKNEGFEEFIKRKEKLFPEEPAEEISDFFIEEFESLKRSQSGENLEVGPSNEINVKVPGIDKKINLKISPVNYLRTVSVQRGYRRLPYIKGEGSDERNNPLISSKDVTSKMDDWYPGFEGTGEGIIVYSEEPIIDLLENRTVRKWLELRDSLSGGSNGRGDEVTHPLFVWWHTLLHSLLKVLSLDCGYSPASLRGRVYVDEKLEKGGFLIYTTTPGDDPGMGGLTEKARNPRDYIVDAIDYLSLCSNDPLCSDSEIHEEKANGAACHGCVLISETSCEYRNKWLDRNLFLTRS